MAPFLGTTIQMSDGEVKKVAFIIDGSKLNTVGIARGVPYDTVLGFPALKEQMDDGKGSKENPITVISVISVGLLGAVAKLWNACSNLTQSKEELVIHNGTLNKRIDELKFDIAVMEELKHPIVDAMKHELQLRENGVWERKSSGESASTSG